jgi:hypothetical protein
MRYFIIYAYSLLYNSYMFRRYYLAIFRDMTQKISLKHIAIK